MPLLILSGYPSSGKSTRAAELKDFFTQKDKTVFVVSENEAVPRAGLKKNLFFNDSQKEKQIRADLKSEALRHLIKDNIVILDAGNYIKGYRYELFCATKAVRTCQCTLFCGISKQQAWEFNQNKTEDDETDGCENNSNVPYSQEMFDALCLRYEEPHGNSRWDSPLFTVFPEDDLDLDGIFTALYKTKPPPPNMSTQNPPLSSTNALFELGKLTQDIVEKVMAARRDGVTGPISMEPNMEIIVPDDITAIQLKKQRMQFLNYKKRHLDGTLNIEKAQQLFVQFVNSNFQE